MTDAVTSSPTGAPIIDPRLAAWERRMNPWIMAAALVPIVVAFGRGEDDPFVVFDFATWLLFVADLAMHIRYRPHYLRTGYGKFDTAIVVLTFPWYVIPTFSGAAILGLARLGRVLRLVLASSSTGIVKRLIDRLGRAGLYAAALITVCSIVVERVEPPSSGYEDLGDALWWGIVTFTTVGYGDLYPVTPEGRLMGVFLMIGGIALIGLLAGSLAEFFSEPTAADPTGATDPTVPTGATDPTGSRPRDDAALLAEMQAMRAEVAELRRLLTDRGPDPPAHPT